MEPKKKQKKTNYLIVPTICLLTRSPEAVTGALSPLLGALVALIQQHPQQAITVSLTKPTTLTPTQVVLQ